MTDRLPSLPLFVDDYEGATTHLTLEEDGAYMRLLRLCWRTPRCSIPDDDNWIMRRMRVDQATYDRLVAPIIDEFFKRSRGRIFQKRLLQEYAYAVERQTKRKEAGKKGGRAKALKNNNSNPSNATVLPEQKSSNALAPSPAQPSPIEEEKEAKASSPSSRTRPQRKTVRTAGEDHPIPFDWQPSLGPSAQRIVDGWPPGMFGREELAFRSHAEANGRVAKNWNAAFGTWIAKAEERRLERADRHQPRNHRDEQYSDPFVQAGFELQAQRAAGQRR